MLHIYTSNTQCIVKLVSYLNHVRYISIVAWCIQYSVPLSISVEVSTANFYCFTFSTLLFLLHDTSYLARHVQ